MGEGLIVGSNQLAFYDNVEDHNHFEIHSVAVATAETSAGEWAFFTDDSQVPTSPPDTDFTGTVLLIQCTHLCCLHV